MQKSFLYLLVIISCFGLASCEDKPSQTAQVDVKDVNGVSIPDTIYSDNYGYALSLSDKRCLADSQYTICEFGLTYIGILGFPLDELKFEENIEVQDTLYTQGGYQWRGKELELEDGSKIFLEGNFVDEGDPANQLPVSSVNRIRVESPLYKTVDGVQVGQTFGALKATLSEEKMVAIYIPSAKMVDLTLPESSGLHFNLPLEAEVELQEGYQGIEIKTSLIPDSTRIHSIVVAF